MAVGTFAGIYLLEGTAPYEGYYVVERDPAGSDSTFNPATTDAGQAARFVIYGSASQAQVQQQYRNQWMSNTSWEGDWGERGLYAIGFPTDVQYGGSLGGTVQFSSSGTAMTLAGGVPSAPDPSLFLVWLGSPYQPFPLVSHVVVPGLAAMRSAGGAPGADFTNVTLDGCDLSGLNLAGANFTNASLQNTSFRGATLTNAILTQQDLRACVLTGAKLGGAHLEGAVLEGVTLDPSVVLSGAHMHGARLANATLAGVDLSSADLRGAIVDRLNLTGANLAGTDFSGLDVTNVTFGASPRFSTDASNLTKFTGATLPFSTIGLDWSYLDLVGATILDLPVDGSGHLVLAGLQAVSANLSGRVFSDANLRSAGGVAANFSAATLVGANFSGADCTSAAFSGSTLGGGPGHNAAVMSEATLFDANFTDAQLSGVNFSGAYLYGSSAKVTGATLAGADFSNAYLTGLDLSNVRDADMAGAVFDGACCVNCTFTGTTIVPDSTGRGGSFVSTCLQGADFADASLAGADLVNAAVAPPCPTPGTCTFPATLKIKGNPVKIQITVNDAGTILPATATTASSVCPDHSNGPCSGAQLHAANAPTSWPVSSTSGPAPGGSNQAPRAGR